MYACIYRTKMRMLVYFSLLIVGIQNIIKMQGLVEIILPYTNLFSSTSISFLIKFEHLAYCAFIVWISPSLFEIHYYCLAQKRTLLLLMLWDTQLNHMLLGLICKCLQQLWDKWCIWSLLVLLKWLISEHGFSS